MARSYKPAVYLPWDPVRVRQDFLDFAQRHINRTEFSLVEIAFDLAVRAHEGQLRMSYEPYITHPIELATILMRDLHFRDGEVISSALLHDVLEDCGDKVDERTIAHAVGDKVLASVRVLSKKSGVDLLHQVRRDGTITDCLIKLCDKLHNIATVHHMQPADARRVVRDARAKFVPFAHETEMRLPLSEKWRAKWLADELDRACRAHE